MREKKSRHFYSRTEAGDCDDPNRFGTPDPEILGGVDRFFYEKIHVIIILENDSFYSDTKSSRKNSPCKMVHPGELRPLRTYFVHPPAIYLGHNLNHYHHQSFGSVHTHVYISKSNNFIFGNSVFFFE